jgi:excisionase family DNA binding protein
MSKDPWTPLTTYQVAQELGISVRRVQALIRAGKLKARKAGRDWLIIYDDLAAVRERRSGRPKKENTDGPAHGL